MQKRFKNYLLVSSFILLMLIFVDIFRVKNHCQKWLIFDSCLDGTLKEEYIIDSSSPFCSETVGIDASI